MDTFAPLDLLVRHLISQELKHQLRLDCSLTTAKQPKGASRILLVLAAQELTRYVLKELICRLQEQHNVSHARLATIVTK